MERQQISDKRSTNNKYCVIYEDIHSRDNHMLNHSDYWNHSSSPVLSVVYSLAPLFFENGIRSHFEPLFGISVVIVVQHILNIGRVVLEIVKPQRVVVVLQLPQMQFPADVCG